MIQQFHNCQVMRCRLVRSGNFSLNPLGDLYIQWNSEDYKIQKCNAPLFEPLEKSLGVCKTCRSGWSVPDNQPTPEGLQLIRHASLSTASKGNA
jgi:hypothetical protein